MSDEQETIDRFHELFYGRQLVQFCGYDLQKNVLDLWVYQELIYELKPDLIVECGTWKGGSAYYLASICDLVGHGLVVTMDVNPWHGFPRHERIMYLTGDTGSLEGSEALHKAAYGFRKVMMILDSDHTKQHVIKELRHLWDIVTPGQYLVVEDCNIHGHPVRTDLPDGPYEAVEEFLKENGNFVVDRNCERFLVTSAPGGFLRRIE